MHVSRLCSIDIDKPILMIIDEYANLGSRIVVAEICFV